jgi:hypothetical protein
MLYKASRFAVRQIEVDVGPGGPGCLRSAFIPAQTVSLRQPEARTGQIVGADRQAPPAQRFRGGVGWR